MRLGSFLSVFRAPFVVAGLFLTGVAGLTPLRAQYDWREMQGNLSAIAISNVTQGGNATNLYVAVGNVGTILTSPDGASWTIRSSGTTDFLRGVAFGNVTSGNETGPTYIAVGDAGTMLKSTDGANWVPQPAQTDQNLRGIIFAQNKFVAYGDGGIVLLSGDGVTWQAGVTGTSNSVHAMQLIIDPARGGELFIAVGEKGTFLRSPDGLSWSIVATSTENNLNSVAYGAGLFVAVGDGGEIQTSPFGIHWDHQRSGTRQNITSVVYDGTKFVGVTSSSTTVISNQTGEVGTQWHTGSTGHWTDLTALVYDSTNSRFVTVGNIGIIVDITSYILTSADGNSWTDYASGSTSGYTDVTNDGTQFIAVGASGGITDSLDGVIWQVTLAVGGNLTFNHIASDTGTGHSVVVGDGQTDSSSPLFYYSTNGQSWNGIFADTTRSLKGIAYNSTGNTWVALTDATADTTDPVAYSLAFTSSNGVAFTKHTAVDTSAADLLNGFIQVAYDPNSNLFVAILSPSTNEIDDYHVRTSADGFTWSAPVAGFTTPVELKDIKLVNNQIIIVAATGQIAVLTWTGATYVGSFPFTGTVNELRGVTYGADSNGVNTWAFVGDDVADNTDTMLTSTDSPLGGGSLVTSLYPSATSGMRALDFFDSPAVAGGNVFVAVGDGGKIFTSLRWAPSLVARVNDQSGVIGGNASFTVQPQPTIPNGFLSFQWQKVTAGVPSNITTDGIKYFGSTTAVLGIANLTNADANVTYRVAVTNGIGDTLYSNNANLTTGTYPIVITQPVDVSAIEGGNATFTVVATGVPTPTYHWRREGVLLTDDGITVQGSSTASLLLSNVSLANSTTNLPNSAGNFSVDITNIIGSISSNTVVLFVGSPPVIIDQPVNPITSAGNDTFFSVTATGSPAPTYQWYLNGNALTDGGNISGSQTSKLNIANVSNANLGVYTVLVSNNQGNVTSDPAILQLPGALTILTQPVSQQAKLGGTVTLSVTAVGTPPVTYQWFFNGVKLNNVTHYSNVTAANMTISGITAAQGGTYYVKVSNDSGFVLSNNVTVSTPLQITTQPQSQTVASFAPVKFTVKVAGGGTIKYQWFFNAAKIANGGFVKGATTATLTITRAGSQFGGKYYVTATNGTNAVTSNKVTLKIKPKP